MSTTAVYGLRPLLAPRAVPVGTTHAGTIDPGSKGCASHASRLVDPLTGDLAAPHWSSRCSAFQVWFKTAPLASGSRPVGTKGLVLDPLITSLRHCVRHRGLTRRLAVVERVRRALCSCSKSCSSARASGSDRHRRPGALTPAMKLRDVAQPREITLQVKPRGDRSQKRLHHVALGKLPTRALSGSRSPSRIGRTRKAGNDRNACSLTDGAGQGAIG